MIWTLAPNADLRWRYWQGEDVVYHPPSGDMHILNPLAAEALRHLENSPATAADLRDHLAAILELQPDATLLRQMEQCIAQFAELGMIEPAESSHAA